MLVVRDRNLFAPVVLLPVGGMRGQIAVRVNVKSLFIAHKKSLAG
jgi:hypothetical protein